MNEGKTPLGRLCAHQLEREVQGEGGAYNARWVSLNVLREEALTVFILDKRVCIVNSLGRQHLLLEQNDSYAYCPI